MDYIWTFSLLTILIGVFYYYLKKKSNYFENLGIPCYKGWPIFGLFGPAFFRKKHVINITLEMYKNFPDAKYIGSFDFLSPIVLLRDPELIKNVTIKNFENFPDHKAFADETLDPLFGANLFNITGEKWKETRSLLSPTFTSSKMKGMYELIVECGKNLNDYLSKRSKKSLRLTNTKDLFAKYTNDVVATCAFGISVDTLKNPNNDFYVLGKEATSFEGVQGLKFFIARGLPRIMKALKIKFVSDRVRMFFEKVVGDTIRTRDEKKITRPDMLQLMMDARDKVELKSIKLDIPNMTAQAFIFFFGGFDTSSTQMSIIAHELALNPDVQKKLQEEIDEVMMKTGNKPKYEDISSMPYLDAVFNESMRKHPQAATLDRMCVKSFELPPAVPGAKPFIVKPGMNVWIPVVGIHMDSKFYEEPEKFNPDRYLKKKVTMNDVTNLGFGIGPRACIGNRFAILQTKILFFFLLSKFNLVPNEITSLSFEYDVKSFAIKPKGGFSLAIEPRDEI